MLRDDVERVVAENAPCMVLAVHLGPAETGTGEPAQSLSVIQAQLDGATPDDVLTGLVGLKAGYSRLVEMMAQTMGMPDQNLHNEIRRHLNETPVQEVGEFEFEMRDQTPEQAADRLVRDYRAFLGAVKTTAGVLGVPESQLVEMVQKRADLPGQGAG